MLRREGGNLCLAGYSTIRGEIAPNLYMRWQAGQGSPIAESHIQPGEIESHDGWAARHDGIGSGS